MSTKVLAHKQEKVEETHLCSICTNLMPNQGKQDLDVPGISYFRITASCLP